MYGVSVISFGPPLKFFHPDFDCCDVVLNSSGPDNFKRVIKYQTSFHGGFKSLPNI